MYCHNEIDVQAFVIAVGITKGCTLRDTTVQGSWEVLSQCCDWKPFEDPRCRQWSVQECRVLRNFFCKSQWCIPVPKFWKTYNAMGTSETETAEERVVIFVETAFSLSSLAEETFLAALHT